jgi:hypothetical protein
VGFRLSIYSGLAVVKFASNGAVFDEIFGFGDVDKKIGDHLLSH